MTPIQPNSMPPSATPSMDDSTPDLDTIKQLLMKVIDQMNQMESQRLLPEGHPLKEKAPAEGVDTNTDPAQAPAEGSISDDEPDASSGDTAGLDSGVLSDLMDKASATSPDGSSPDDMAGSDLPPEILSAVMNKKKKPV